MQLGELNLRFGGFGVVPPPPNINRDSARPDPLQALHAKGNRVRKS